MGTSAPISTATKCIQLSADAVCIYPYHHLTAVSLHTFGMNIGKRGPRSPQSYSECHKKSLILSLSLPCRIWADTLEALPPRCSWRGSLVIPSHSPFSSHSPQPYLNTPGAHFRTRTRAMCTCIDSSLLFGSEPSCLDSASRRGSGDNRGVYEEEGPASDLAQSKQAGRYMDRWKHTVICNCARGHMEQGSHLPCSGNSETSPVSFPYHPAGAIPAK